jgi:hypothetical protein
MDRRAGPRRLVISTNRVAPLSREILPSLPGPCKGSDSGPPPGSSDDSGMEDVETPMRLYGLIRLDRCGAGTPPCR